MERPQGGYVLSHVLKAHSLDVKCVATAYDHLSESELIFSASRDETGICWSRPCSDDQGEKGSNSFQRGSTYQAQRYANAIEYVQPSPQLPRGQVLLGSLDSQIRSFDPTRPDKPSQVLSEHWDNVSVIKAYHHVGKPCFISGSWDKTARVWTNDSSSSFAAFWSCQHVLKGHEQAVWGVGIVEPPQKSRDGDTHGGRYLTSSADMFIRLFHGEDLTTIYAGHTDVVRSLILLPPHPASDSDLFPGEQLFASCSNDMTVRVWSLDKRRSPNPGNGGEPVRVLEGHTSLVYDLAHLAVTASSTTPLLISSGEDGTVRIWDWINGTLQATLPQPAISAWSVAVLERSQDLVTGLSDGTVRVYTRRLYAPSEGDTCFDDAPVTQAQLEQHAEQVHAVSITVKARDTTSEPEAAKELFEAQWYDAVLRIDVSDDAEPLPLPINVDDDCRTVARNFVQRHSLPESYESQIVAFINMVLPPQKDSAAVAVTAGAPSTSSSQSHGAVVSSQHLDESEHSKDIISRSTAPQSSSVHLLPQLNSPASVAGRLEQFHQQHFQDEAKRAHFASQLGQTTLSPMVDMSASVPKDVDAEDDWAALRSGETESEWQLRHGVEHLTPESVRIFDQSRRFRARRDEATDQEPH